MYVILYIFVLAKRGKLHTPHKKKINRFKNFNLRSVLLIFFFFLELGGTSLPPPFYSNMHTHIVENIILKKKL